MNEILRQNSPFMNELALSQFEPQSNVQVPFKPANLPTAGQNAATTPDDQLACTIVQLEDKFRENLAKIQQLRQTIAGIQSKYAPKQMSEDNLERAMAANRARRIKKDDAALSQWRWKKEQDLRNKQLELNYKWQKGMNDLESELGKITSRNEFNEKLNTATKNWLDARKSGDAIAEAHAKQALDGVLQFGKIQYGIDGSAEIQKAVALQEQNDQNKKNQWQKWSDFDTEKRGYDFKTPENVFAWNSKVRKAWEEGLIDDDQRDKLYFTGASTTEERKTTVKNTGLQLTAEQIKQRDAANKLTPDEFVAKISKGEALNTFEEKALKSPKIKKHFEGLYTQWQNATGSRKDGLYKKYSTIFQKLGFKI